MTPAELRHIRHGLKLSVRGLAQLLRMGTHGERTVRRWEKGLRRIPLAARALLLELHYEREG